MIYAQLKNQPSKLIQKKDVLIEEAEAIKKHIAYVEESIEATK